MSKIATVLGLVSVAMVSSVYAQIGSPAWTAAWPPADQSKTAPFLPEWETDFDTIQFTGTAAAPVVPSGSVGKTNSQYCDWSYNLCNGTSDIIQCSAPLQWGLSFDDGPIPPQSNTLYDFLAANNIKATHFMIGTNIVQWPQLVTKAFQQGDQIAVHTWTHHPMTTLDSKTAYAELRWGIEIIKNITGVTPLHWRPPYGDVDDRIRAIAKHLSLTTNIWNQDTNDWCIGDPTAAADGCGNFVASSVHTNLEAWAANQKTAPKGLVVLEHELSNGSVSEFMEALPVMKSNGWQIMPVGTCNNVPWYAESNSTNSTNSTTTSSVPATSAPVTSSGSNASATDSSAPVTTTAPPKASSGSSLTLGAFSAGVIAFLSFTSPLLDFLVIFD
jgi:peptidoglycan/xylan/chitin deacetylase (PgdA/CDA1 family)